MGSIVKTIGKVIKKVGKALKKIAPILLVAAAAYVGYGYMTGFQAGGWPQITEWGKSLVSGVSQGQTLSQAANAAGGMVETGAAALGETEALMSGLDASADVTSRALTSGPATTSTAIGGGITDGMGLPDMGAATGGAATGGITDGMGLPTEGGLLGQIQNTTNTRFTALMDQSLYPPISNQVSSWTAAPAKQSGVGDFFVGSAQASTAYPPSAQASTAQLTPQEINPVPSVPKTLPAVTDAGPAVTTPSVTQATVPFDRRNPYGWQSNQYGGMAGPHLGNQQGFMQAMTSFFGDKIRAAYNIYKGMWADNPWMAAWTTTNVIRTIAQLLNTSEAEELERSRYVAGFKPGGPEDVKLRYGGNLPGGNINRAGVGEKRRQSSLKAGPQISGKTRISAIDRKPQGLLASKQPRQVERVVG